ncbi:hypothetical protein V6N13_144897 [Hibiscus sabdariffa]|uniref:Uncharacterized protein n=1 Tax=Hibiscus sabdariffa TaxID=183260 RepID=A0ABR2FLS8_9ROSI
MHNPHLCNIFKASSLSETNWEITKKERKDTDLLQRIREKGGKKWVFTESEMPKGIVSIRMKWEEKSGGELKRIALTVETKERERGKGHGYGLYNKVFVDRGKQARVGNILPELLVL